MKDVYEMKQQLSKELEASRLRAAGAKQAQRESEQKAGLAGRERPPRLPTPTVDLPLTAYIPEKYMTDINTRLSLYQKLVKLEAVEPIEALAQEFSDRFGALPVEVKNLLYTAKIKVLAAQAGIESISTEDGQIILRRFSGMPFNQQKLEPLKDGIKVGTTRISLNPKRIGREWQKVLEEVVTKIR